MEKKTIKFLTLATVLILALCILIFSGINYAMDQENEAALNQISEVYMAGMNRQLREHFISLIAMRLDQVEGIVEAVPPEEFEVLDAGLVRRLTLAGSNDFDYLALYGKKGGSEVIYGGDVEIDYPDGFLDAMNHNRNLVATGTAPDGERICICGVSVGYPDGMGYPMPGGRENTALVAGFPFRWLDDILDLDMDNGALVYTHIIKSDGTFILKNVDTELDNYFDWLRDVRRKDRAADNVLTEEIIASMQAAMEGRETYSSIAYIDGELSHFYCSPLPDTRWTLVTVMPHGILDETINTLGFRRLWASIFAGGVVGTSVLSVFLIYLVLSIRQMNLLRDARTAAEQASKAKSTFLSNMSHDIRTPMNAILGMSAIASSSIGNDERVMDCLRKITASSRHLLGLINDVLDMSKIESGNLSLRKENVSLRELVEGVTSIVQPQMAAKKQQFDIFLQDIRTERVCSDSVRLSQVLLNLLSNAVKFTPEGGRITVTLRQEESGKGEGYVRLHLDVQDSGIGMSPAFLDRIFDSFSREDDARIRKTEGTGLGMAITRRILDAMGGTIRVESGLDQGSKFSVILDLERAEEMEEDMILPACSILVVDDDRELCLGVASSLAEIGLEAEWVLDGVSAIRLAERRHAESRDYQFILLDWQMPEMNGIETAIEIRRRIGPEVSILIISAYDWGDIEEEARKAGIDGFIQKPLFKSSLYHGLRPFLLGVEREEEVEESAEGAERLLVAEDNDLNWEIAESLLSSCGFQPVWAQNGKLCVEAFEASEPGYFAAVLMDLRMPEMDGYEATRSIRASGRPDSGIPIIAMTADAFAEDAQRCLACGMNAHIAKPIDIDKLAALIRQQKKTPV